jgi:hypothetical protein
MSRVVALLGAGLLLTCGGAVYGASTVPFADSFDYPDETSLDGTNGWGVTGTGSAIATNGRARLGDVTVSNVFTGEEEAVTITFDLQPRFNEGNPSSLIPSDATYALYVGTNGLITAFDGQAASNLTHDPLSESSTTQMTVRVDYPAETWSLWLGDTKIATDFGFYGAAASNFTEVGFVEGSTNAYSYVDNVEVEEVQALVTVSMSDAAAQGAESVGLVTATVVLNTTSTNTVSVDHFLSGGTADFGTDFTNYTGGTLTFSPGQTTTSVTFTVIDDTENEPDETIVIGLSNFVNGVAGDYTNLTYTILYDLADEPAVVSFATDAVSYDTQTSTGSVEVTLFPAQVVTVKVDHAVLVGSTATAGLDYTDYTPGTLTFDPGETNKTITFTVAEDGEGEDETIVLGLSSFVNASAGTYSNFTYTILGDTNAWYALPFYEPFENRTLGDLDGQFGWEASGVTVQTNVVHSGSRAGDLNGQSSVMTHSFVDGKTFLWTDLYIQPVFAADDTDSVTNVPAGSSFAFYVNTNGLIVAYDGMTPTQLVHAALTPGEWVRFTVQSDYANTNWDLLLDGDPNPVASDLQFYDPTATAFTEFGVRGAGDTNAYVDEVRIEETHPFVPSAVYATATLAVAETQGTVTATVILSETYDEEVRVDHYLVGGTAAFGEDFTNYSGGTLIFATNETNMTFTFDVLNDTNSEPAETIIFGLTAYSNCAPYEPSTLTVTIGDDGSDWTLPFYEPFEGLALGDLLGQNGWRGEGSIVQGDVVFAGQKAGSVTSMTGVASHPFGDGQTNVWSDLYIQPDFGGNNNSVSNPPAGSSFGFFVNSDGYVVAFDGTTRTQLVHDALSEGNWTRFTVHSDYANTNWDLYLFGDMIAGGLEFYDPAAVAYSEFGVRGAGSSDAHLDEVRIQDSSPPLTSASFEPSEDANDETTNTVTVTVVLNAASGDEVRADHYLSGGTADIGDDFTYTPGTLIFDPGETTQTFSFTVINDFVPELDETIVFGMSNLVNAAIGWNPNFTYTILPEDTINWYVLPFTETFENRLEADLDGQYGWSSGSATVQTAVVYSGTKSAIIAEGGNIAHPFVGDHTNVWSDIYVRPLRGVPPAVPANSTFAFYVNTNGHVMAYDGDTATDLTPPAPTVAEGKWARFTVHSDYTDKTWDLYVNGMRRGEDLAFYSTSTTGYSEFGIKISGGTNEVRSSYVDNIKIGFNRPFGVHDFGTLLIIR